MPSSCPTCGATNAGSSRRSAAPIPLYAPHGVVQRLQGLEEEDQAAILDVFDCHPLPNEGPYDVGPFELRSWALPHFVPNIGVRPSAEKLTIAYTGDPGPDPRLAELAANADLHRRGQRPASAQRHAPGRRRATSASAPRTLFVLGGQGFIGGYIVAALRAQGWRVICGVRPSRAVHGGSDTRPTDLSLMGSAEDWRGTLDGIDGVVNVAGILREIGADTFETIHVTAPAALASACIEAGIRNFVQISALGEAADGEFIASKLRFDEQLLRMPLRAAILRPSVVYATSGSYGGTSLLRAQASLPGFSLLPGDGRWQIQPLSAEDLGVLVVCAIERDVHGIYAVGGPDPMTLREYQSRWRRWMRIAGDRVLQVPEQIVSLQVWLGQRLGRGPTGETMWRMLRRNNVLPNDAISRMHEAFGFVPRALDEVLAARPSQVQDRWAAQLYFLAPLLRFTIVLLWLLSALAGWTASETEILAMAVDSSMQHLPLLVLARATATLNLVLGLSLALGWRPRLVIALMGLSVIAYTATLGTLIPDLWLEPLGGMAKNLVVLPALAIAWVLADRR